MQNKYMAWGAIVAVFVFVAVAVWTASPNASAAKYNFIARGIVTGVDLANKTIEVDVTKAVPTIAAENLEGSNWEFKVGDAKVVKVASGKDTRVTYKNIVIGQELGMKGTALDDDTFTLNFARIHDRSFQVVGTLDEHNEATRTVKILVTSSTYKPSTYKNGAEITMQYSEANSTFYEKTTKTEKTFSEVDANNQKVKVTGTVTGSNTWEIKTLIDSYTGN